MADANEKKTERSQTESLGSKPPMTSVSSAKESSKSEKTSPSTGSPASEGWQTARENLNEIADDVTTSRFASQLDHQIRRIPASGYLSLAVASMGVSAVVALLGGNKKGWASFIGMWAPSLLALSVYSRLSSGRPSEDASHSEQVPTVH